MIVLVFQLDFFFYFDREYENIFRDFYFSPQQSADDEQNWNSSEIN